MAWIESHTVLIRHRKLVDLAKKLRLKPVYVLGHLHALWHAVLEQQEDGDISKWSDELIADLSCYPGDAPQYVRLLHETGWLKNRLVHDWLDYAGRYLESRYHTSNPARLAEVWKKHGLVYEQPKGRLKETFRLPLGDPPTNLPNPPNLTNQTVPTARAGPPTPQMLLDRKIDFETFLKIWWGKEGVQPYPILQEFVQLSRIHGWKNVGEAVIQSARQNVRKIAYVRGILTPKESEQAIDHGKRNGQQPRQISDVKITCDRHPKVILDGDSLCPECFPKCIKCSERHLADESCNEWKDRLKRLKNHFAQSGKE